MKKIIILLLSFIICSFSLSAQQVWKMDKAHAKMTFTVTHLGISEIDGVFRDFEATVTSTKEDFSDAVFELTANLKELDTNHDGRNGHLQKDDMFDTANHPTMTFKSTSIEQQKETNFKLTGDLTIKGVTKEVSIYLTLLGTTIHRRSKKKLAGFKATGTVNRKDFGVGNMPDMMVSEAVELRASGEFILQ